jgi:hypothetical protein
MTTKTLPLLIALLPLSAALLAGARADERPPAPAPELKKTVDALAGHWAFDGTITLPGGKPKRVKMKLDCTRTAAGKAVYCLEDTVVVDLGPMQAAYLVGYDTFGKRVHFMAMTSDEAVHDHRCDWKNDRELACETLAAGMNGAPVTEEFGISFNGNLAVIKATMVVGGGNRMTFEVKGRRT